MTETTHQPAPPTPLQQALAVPARLTRDAVVGARHTLSRTAAAVAGAKRPVQRLSHAGARINTVTHDGVAALIQHQTQALQGTLDDTAQRLQVAAEAGSLRGLMSEQLAMLPQTRSRVAADLRATLRLLNDTRCRLGDALREEFGASSSPAAGDASVTGTDAGGLTDADAAGGRPVVASTEGSGADATPQVTARG